MQRVPRYVFTICCAFARLLNMEYRLKRSLIFSTTTTSSCPSPDLNPFCAPLFHPNRRMVVYKLIPRAYFPSISIKCHPDTNFFASGYSINTNLCLVLMKGYQQTAINLIHSENWYFHSSSSFSLTVAECKTNSETPQRQTVL